jgi:hypothetical protein
VINCVTPGLCKSDIQRDSSGNAVMEYLMNTVLAVFQRRTEVGGSILVDGIVSHHDDCARHGAFVVDCGVAE